MWKTEKFMYMECISLLMRKETFLTKILFVCVSFLLHRYEINKIEAKLKEKGLTLVPLKVYFKDSLVKIEIGMARGKKLYDKRQDIAKKDQRREAERDFKVKNLY